MADFGNVAIERAAIEATYEDTLAVARPANHKVGSITKTKLKAAGGGICALSQNGGGAGNQAEAFNLVEYDAKIFTAPELVIQKGDTLTVKRFGRSDPESKLEYTFEPVGAPAVYPTHQEVLVKVRDKA